MYQISSICFSRITFKVSLYSYPFNELCHFFLVNIFNLKTMARAVLRFRHPLVSYARKLAIGNGLWGSGRLWKKSILRPVSSGAGSTKR